NLAIHIEYDSDIRLDIGGGNDATITSGKLLDLVRAKESNGFCLKMTNASRARCCCCAGSFVKLRQNARVARNRYFIYHPDTAYSAPYPGLQIGPLLHRPFLA